MPTLNEEKGVGITIDSIKKNVFKKNKWDLKITIIDGNSKDKTKEKGRCTNRKKKGIWKSLQNWDVKNRW